MSLGHRSLNYDVPHSGVRQTNFCCATDFFEIQRQKVDYSNVSILSPKQHYKIVADDILMSPFRR